MYLKKITAILVAAVMLMVCIIPMTGYGNDATDSYFVEDVEQKNEVPDGYTAITDVEDLKRIGTEADGSGWGLNDKYIQMNDIVFSEDDAEGTIIKVNAAVTSSSKLTVTVTADKTITDAVVIFKTYQEPLDNGTVTITASSAFSTSSSAKTYTLSVFGKCDGEWFAVSMTIPTGTSSDTTAELNSVGNFTPIGSKTSPFTGEYDGNGYKIVGMETADINDSGVSGMFGYTSGTLENIGLSNGSSIAVDISGTEYARAGGLAGQLLENGTIYNCYNTGTVTAVNVDGSTSLYNSAGGIAGVVDENASIEFSYNSGRITASAYGADAESGGIAGYSDLGAVIEYSKNTGAVQAFSATKDTYVGGIVAYAEDDIETSYNYAHIFSESLVAKSYAGGVVGFSDGKVASCYNVGTVEAGLTDADKDEGSTYVGGIAGDAPVIYNCYNFGSLTARTHNTSSNDPTATSNVGGIAGTSENIYNCYSNTSSISASAVTENRNRGGIVGSMNADPLEGDVGMITNCYYRTISDLVVLCGNGYTDVRGEEGLKIDGIIMKVIEDFDDSDPPKSTGFHRDEDTVRDQSPSGAVAQNDLRSYHTYFNGQTDITDPMPADPEPGVDYIPGWWVSIDGVVGWASPADSGFTYPSINALKPSIVEVLTQPEDVWLKEMKGDVTFEVTMYSDSPTVSYRWQSATSITGSWSSAKDTNNQSTYTIDASSTEASKYYRCQITATYGGTSVVVYSDAAKIHSYTSEIRTVQDLVKISENPSGSYIQMNDIHFNDKDTNGGLKMIVKAELSGNELKVTVLYDETKPVKGVYVMIDNEYEITDSKGTATFNAYDPTKAWTLYVFGVVGANNIAVQYDLAKDLEDIEIEASSNGNFDPIGTLLNPFTGEYDGNGYSIYGLNTSVYSESVSAHGQIYASSGLFGYVCGGTIKGLSIKDSASLAAVVSPEGFDNDAMASAGGIVGFAFVGENESTYIQDCSNSGSVTSVAIELGDFARAVSGGIAGGMIGDMDDVMIIDRCSNTGKIVTSTDGASNIAGGIVGSAEANITDCYNTGSFACAPNVNAGGIAGDAYKISNCYSTATLTTGMYGIAYRAEYITNCYFVGTVSIAEFYDEIDGGETRAEGQSGAKTLSDLKKKSTYHTAVTTVDGDDIDGWDFSEIWKIGSSNNGLPYLKAVDHKGGDDGDGGIDTWIIIAAVAAIAVVVLAALYLIRRRA